DLYPQRTYRRHGAVRRHCETPAAHAQHLRHARSVEVDVEHADLIPLTREGEREIHGGHALADAAFPAHHNELVANPGHPVFHRLHLFGDLLDHFGVVGILQTTKNVFKILRHGIHFRVHDSSRTAKLSRDLKECQFLCRSAAPPTAQNARATEFAAKKKRPMAPTLPSKGLWPQYSATGCSATAAIPHSHG